VKAPARFVVGKSSKRIDGVVRKLVRDAYRNVPRFRRRLDATSVPPHEIRSAGDLRRIPIETRAAIFAVPRDDSIRQGVNLRSCPTCETSGTTGEPLTIYLTRSEMLYRRLLLFRAMRRNARFSFPLTMAEVGTGLIRMGAHRRDIVQGSGVVRVTKIARSLSGTEQARQLLLAAPQIVIGPPSCLELAAEAIESGGLVVSGWPRLVVARGEVMTRATRGMLRRTFSCPVVDYYNSEEVGNIAWECPDESGRMHVNTDGCIVEIADEEGHVLGEGEEGSVVITNLFNWTMPFIRYRMGDRAALFRSRRCSCGFDGPSLSLVSGRTSDFLNLSTGERVSPRTVDSVIAKAGRRREDSDLFELKRYQAQQDAGGRLTVLIVPREGAGPGLDERVREALTSLDPGLDVTVRYVSEIPLEASGKFKVVRREVPSSGPEA